MMKDNLEKAFHDALINHEVEYNPAAWSSLQKQLPTNKTPWYVAGAAATIVVAVLLFSLFNNEESKKEVTQNQELIVPSRTDDEKNNEKNNQSKVEIKTNSTQKSTNNSYSDHGILSVNNSQKSRTNKTSEPHRTNQASAQMTITSENTFDGQTTPIGYHEERKFIEDFEKATENIKIQGTRNMYCENSTVTFKAVNVPDKVKIEWSFSNTNRVITGNVAEFKVEKNMNVKMDVIPVEQNKTTNSISTTFLKLNVLEVSKPKVDVASKEQNTKNFVTLTNTNPDVDHLLWRFENNTFKGQSCGTYFTSKGTHLYTVESYDKNGCFSTTQGQIEVKEDYNLYVQNTFTPNGDGINEYFFIPEALKVRAVNFKMSIFDKTGRLIYSTTDAHQPWNGTFNGQPVAQDTYIWLVTLINEEGMPEQYKGQINVNRP